MGSLALEGVALGRVSTNIGKESPREAAKAAEREKAAKPPCISFAPLRLGEEILLSMLL